ncbi:hypothetical protein NXS08_04210 [Gleimia sp. 6138-11-ORH1]|uniref:hypothetical protein n=1 Tax=Gleimia sp. 6138-11-ORH1 TaxID=2973937 RepID=UPI0021682685|nr:hypothetical protein [Gleimia sp. 6138-11-ORH1]MCS4484690.1 hypothetical protein [Gleimia sp. 6138-11-ORH1]
MSRFRRPAMLSAEQAENIIGAEDPAATLHVANTAARSLIGLADEDFSPAAIEHLVETITTSGIDLVADLWEEQPAFTLAGAFWRLYLFQQWYRRDKETVEERYQNGLAVLQQAGQTNNTENLNLSDLDQEIEKIFTAQLQIQATEWGKLAPLLTLAATAMWVLATGAAYGSNWIESDQDELATEVTRRAKALTLTAKELKLAADRDQTGNLI